MTAFAAFKDYTERSTHSLVPHGVNKARHCIPHASERKRMGGKSQKGVVTDLHIWLFLLEPIYTRCFLSSGLSVERRGTGTGHAWRRVQATISVFLPVK